jgi:hypothetical protein
MESLRPWTTGLSLAVTVVIAYAACALAFLAFPALAMAFLESLFHGVRFAKLPAEAQRLRVAEFGLVTIALFAYAFVVGWLFAVVRNALAR